MERSRRGGWPTRAPDPGERVQLSFRVTPTIKKQLDEAAEASGRSLAQETELRLETSFRDRQLLEEALALAFGRETAAVLLTLGKINEQAEDQSLWVLALAGRDAELNADWIAHGFINHQVIDGMIRALEALRATGDASPPSHDTDGNEMSRMAARAGQRAVANVLDAILDPELAVRGLGRWARPVREKFGKELIERIRKAERPDKKSAP